MNAMRILSALVLTLLSAGNALAAPIESGSDYLFADPGKVQISVATGTPFVGIAEAAVGITNGFTIGVIAGQVPGFYGLGIRPRGRIALSANTQIQIVSPILYYPPIEVSNDMPWMLVKPMLLVDQRVHNRWHVNAEAGLILVTCLDSIANVFTGGEHGPAGHHNEEPEEAEFGGVFNTFGGGVSFEASERTDVFLKGAIAMEGLSVTGGRAIVPLVSSLGLTYRI